MSSADEVLATVRRITAACEAVGLTWAVGGSFASAVYGEPRATNDVDVIARLRLVDVRRFVAALGHDVYVDEDMIREAIAQQRGPEDILLQKLRWYRLGEEQSDRQWRDIGSILRGTKNELDWGYLRSTATASGLADLLGRAEHEQLG